MNRKQRRETMRKIQGEDTEIQQQEMISTTDPDSTFHGKGDRPAKLGYFDNYLIDNRSCVIVDVEATQARLSQVDNAHGRGLNIQCSGLHNDNVEKSKRFSLNSRTK